MSLSEFTAIALREAPKATLVGSPTVGVDGDVRYFDLPGGLHTSISTTGVYYPDGKETQRIGIQPDVYVRPTIEGIREGRDEELEDMKLIRKEKDSHGFV